MSLLRRLFTAETSPGAHPAEPQADPLAGLPDLDAVVQAELATVGGADLPRKLLTMFLGETPQQLADIRGGLESGELTPVRKVAHSIKGAAASIGAARVEAVARALEHAARQGEISQVPALTGQLETALDRLGALES